MKPYQEQDAYKMQVVGDSWNEPYNTYLLAYEWRDIGLSGWTLDASNMEALRLMAATGGEYLINTSSDWLSKHIKTLLVAPDNANLEAIQEALNGLESYAIIDDMLWSMMEYDAIQEGWKDCPMRERIEYCASSGLSIFAARSEEVPEELFETLNSVYC